MGWATELKTITSDAVRKGLALAVDTGREVVDCLQETSEEEMKKLPTDHYLSREHLE